MSYLRWAVLALVSYTMVAPLVRITTRDVPSDVVVLVTNVILVGTATVIVGVSDSQVLPYLTHPKAPYMYAAGVFLTVGILAYYRALALGPVSVVVPVFGLFVVTSSVIGVVALEESLTARKALGVALAVVAIYLTTVE
jgi:transporter family protein